MTADPEGPTDGTRSEDASGRRTLKQFLDSLNNDELVDRLNLALDGASLGIWDWDLRDNSVQFDRRWCEMLGLDVETVDMNLSSWESRVHPDDIEGCYRDIQNYLTGKTPYYENIHRMKHESGEWIYILDRGRLSGWDEAGKPIRFTGTHFDCTATEKAKRLLQRGREILAQLISRLPTAVAMFDEEGRYMAASSEWLSMHGLDECFELGKTPNDLGRPLPSLWDEPIRAAHAGKVSSSDRDVLENPDGRKQFLKWEVRPWQAAGARGILITCEDITASVERQMVEEGEARLASLGLMAAGLAHELNTPLQTLLLAGESMRALLAEGEGCERIREDVDLVGETTTRIANIVGALKNVSRHRPSEAPYRVDARQVAQQQQDLCGARFRDTGVEFRVLVPEEDLYVRGKGPDIAQILLNLLANSLDAVRGREERWVELKLLAHDGEGCFRVTDSGPEIRADVARRLMMPFFTTKEPGRGTGLGLSLSTSLAEQMGGRLVYVASAKNTTFELILPSAEAPR